MMRMYDIIEKKRDGHALTKEEITFFIDAYTKGKIADYQASALLMAIYIQGMTMEESAHLTKAMVHSGEIIDLSAINGIKVDKHSTGGVGDTTTLILAPLVASVGVKVAKMSGRGLGHTGGTLDKLEAIDGFTIEISNKRFIDLVNKNNVAVIGQSNDLAPADKLLYQLRDVTATVSSIPLIASSIMSKKIASGADAIVLDVKTGSGAFMKSFDHAKKLAETMVRIGQLNDVKTSALITNMDQPLGNYIGNALEVYEAILTLKGEGPKDLTELTIQLGAHMVVQAKKASSISEAKQMLKENIKNGKAIEYLKTFIKAQGGNEHIVDEPKQLINATYTYTIKAKETGYISNLHAEEIGKCAMMLGAGRETLDSIIDLAVGIVVHKKIGQHVREGDVLFTIHTNSEPKEDVVTLLKQSYELSETKTNEKLILHVID